MTTKRILSLDGGGIRGVFQAAVLAELSDLNLVQQMDLLAGTSSGAILAVFLALGKTPVQLKKLYLSLGKHIFSHRANLFHRHVLGRSAYSSARLKHELGRHLDAGALFGNCAIRVLVPAVSLDTFTLRVFDSENPQDAQIPILDILLATTAAPTYFSPHRFDEMLWIDGGVACNNPSWEAVLALANAVGLSNIKCLSIGNGTHPETSNKQEYLEKTPLQWAPHLIDICMRTSSHEAHRKCHATLGSENYLRLDLPLGSDMALDDYPAACTILLPHAHQSAGAFRSAIEAWLF